MSVKFTYDGLKELEEKFNNIEKNFNEDVINNILKNVGVVLTGKIKENFYKQVNAENEKWQPLKAGGRYKNGKFDTSAKILLDEGRLVNSINFNIKNNILEIGTPVFYAQYHQNGDGVPKRSFLPQNNLPDDWNNDIFNIIEKVLINLV